jgi:GNAT superfamily N-acetyltransferase
MVVMGRFDDDVDWGGIATIALHGEMDSGLPTIVAVWVRPNCRCKGLGRVLFEKAVDCLLERGQKPHVDIVSDGGRRLLESLPPAKREQVIATDGYLPFANIVLEL